MKFPVHGKQIIHATIAALMVAVFTTPSQASADDSIVRSTTAAGVCSPAGWDNRTRYLMTGTDGSLRASRNNRGKEVVNCSIDRTSWSRHFYISAIFWRDGSNEASGKSRCWLQVTDAWGTYRGAMFRYPGLGRGSAGFGQPDWLEYGDSATVNCDLNPGDILYGFRIRDYAN